MKKTVSLLLALVLAASLLPGAALAAGSYTAAMPMDQSASVGEETALRLVLGSADSTDYAAAYLVLSYDAARLAFTGCSDASYAVNDAVGTVTLARYGASASFGAVTLTFRPIAAGDTTVRLTAANIDAKGNANVQDAPRRAFSTRKRCCTSPRATPSRCRTRALRAARPPPRAGTTPLRPTRRTTITPISPLRSAEQR